MNFSPAVVSASAPPLRWPRGCRAAPGSDADALPIGLASVVLSALVAALGLSVIIGWHARAPLLLQVVPSFAPMQYNGALGFLFGGLGLIAVQYGRQRVAVVLGSIVALMGAATFMQYATGADFGIDQLLMRPYITVATSHPGRMGPNTALCFALVGSALVGFGLCRSEGATLAAGMLGTVVVGLGLVAATGYLTGVETAYGWQSHTRMAVHTAFGFIGLGAAIYLFARGHDGAREPGGSSLFTVVPIGLFSVVLALALWEAVVLHERNLIRFKIAEQASSLRSQIELTFQGRVQALERMANRWAVRGQMPRAEWEADANLYTTHHPEWQAIEWVDEHGRVRWVMPWRGNERAANVDLATLAVWPSALEARDRGVVAFSSMLDLPPGGAGLLAVVPIGRGERSDGFIVGVLRFWPLFDSVLSSTSNWNLTAYADERLVFRNYGGAGAAPSRWTK